ncbi:SsgA family sporulation/cell division regulator [Actinokineospora sp. UTMC 2448]|uniref:SsgA family sporulation/cell division regulator n=1 Tax=Actinokineospora sp. UTMC 2448 TaxID=2268449 RepID=UPI0021649FD4|nr:SsgA family sporulation/cell division regulator [Actinokineospora sp. UTMC 2448]UVS82038.1 sporulation and cell division protein [Actinokineospora sp. UTMC 2448]
MTSEHTEQLISLYNGSIPVRSRWTYRTAEPFTIAAAFQTDNDSWVKWVFARDLLLAGLSSAAGEGDVRFRPGSDASDRVLYVEIESPDGHAMLVMSHADVADFAAVTAAMVPVGEESDFFDVDALIAEITNV